MKLLLHICCVVCACALADKFRKEGTEVTGYFYNPNIHPFQEFLKRLKAVKTFAEQEKIKVYYDETYGLDSFMGAIGTSAKTHDKERCPKCYRMRLEEAARKAHELGCDEFTSTLIVSPQQNQEIIRKTGEEMANRHNVKFRYEELTGHYLLGKETAKKRMLYRQQYCGCIFSEAERYLG
ncbi:MAG: epoxyqueuosine reductase QueH [Planctomycetes bacterium]|nr:epoxyqueuosine reductase QueH [Planctomycetota bacterium]